MREIIVGKNETGKRFDKLLSKVLCNSNKSFIYKMLRKKNITLNDKKAAGNEILNAGDVIKIYFSDDTFNKLSDKSNLRNENENLYVPNISKRQIEAFEESIVFENDNILIADKPDNILSQKAHQSDISMNDLLIAYLLKTDNITNEDMITFTPSFVNRLDRNTTGLIVAGKTYSGLRIMSELIKERTVHKYYYVLVWGKPKKSQRLEDYLYKDTTNNKVTVTSEYVDGADKIITEYKKIWQYENLSLLEVNLITGKTHQIRAHLSSIGLPVIGDIKYGSKKINSLFKKEYNVNRQMLHSAKFVIPKELALKLGIELRASNDDFCISTGLPKDFECVMKKYEKRDI